MNKAPLQGLNMKPQLLHREHTIKYMHLLLEKVTTTTKEKHLHQAEERGDGRHFKDSGKADRMAIHTGTTCWLTLLMKCLVLKPFLSLGLLEGTNGDLAHPHP